MSGEPWITHTAASSVVDHAGSLDGGQLAASRVDAAAGVTLDPVGADGDMADPRRTVGSVRVYIWRFNRGCRS